MFDEIHFRNKYRRRQKKFAYVKNTEEKLVEKKFDEINFNKNENLHYKSRKQKIEFRKIWDKILFFLKQTFYISSHFDLI